MTSSFTPGAPASSSRKNEAASSTCSKLSSSSSVCLSRRYSSSASRAECPGRSLTPSSSAIVLATSPASAMRPSSTSTAPAARPRERRSPRAPGASSPIRLAPVSVRSRTSSRRRSARISRSSRVRPTKDDERLSRLGSACAAPSAGGSAATRSSAGSWSRIERSSCRSASVGSMPSVSTSERLASRYAASASACLSRAVEGEHQLGAEALPERVLADQQLELGDELGTRAEREIRLDPLLQGLDPELLEPRDLGLRPGLVGELGQRRPSPERERLPQHPVRLGRVGGPRVPTSCSNRSRSNDPASARSSYAEETVRITSRPSARRS